MPGCLERAGTGEREWLRRIRAEYIEMPGMALTKRQIRRLWGMDADLCDHLLDELVHDGFLRMDAHESYVRSDRSF